MKTCKKLIKSLKKETWLLIATIGSIVIGITLGLSLRANHHFKLTWTKRNLSYLKFPGEVFLRMLQMLIVPLITSSIISSLARMNVKTAGRLVIITMVYCLATTAIAVIEGVVLVSIINPGKWSQGREPKNLADDGLAPCVSTAVDTILDLVRNLFPKNLVTACTHSTKTCTKYRNRTSGLTLSNEETIKLNGETLQYFDEFPVPGEALGTNILGLIVFSMVLGAVVSLMEHEGEPLTRFFRALESATMRIISMVIWYSPFGIVFLVASQIVEMDDPSQELYRLSGYMITVTSGLALHGVAILPAIYFLCTRKNPYKFVYGMLPALLTALGTSSSSATLPLTIKCCEENNGIDPKIARFVLPLGATLNMDGTAIYEAVATLYIAQVLNKSFSLGGLILVTLTTTLASIGVAGIPQAGIISMIMVLIAVGLPSNYFILIIPVDWFLDRFRTLINVHGDGLGAGIVQSFCTDFLRYSNDGRRSSENAENFVDNIKAVEND